MSDIVIRVENLSKQYEIGVAKTRHDTLRDHLTEGFKSLFRRDGQRSAVSAQRSAPSETIWALKDVSFEIQRGEVVGFIGRNGAGKSTLLKILSRITEPTSGFAEIRGRVGSLLEVGSGFHGELTGRENIYLNGAILGMKKWEIEKKFDEIVEFSGVEKFIDTPVKRYSSGMYTRLAFAVAAHLETEIFIVDEVLAVGDAEFQRKCLGKMGNVANEGRTILFVSHNMQAVNSLCSRGIFLKAGKIEESGDVTTVVNGYLASTMEGVSQGLERIWDDVDTAPGNDKIRLHRIGFIPMANQEQQLIEISKSFKIEVEYWNLLPQKALFLNLSFYSIDGAPAFETIAPKQTNCNGQLVQRGLFRSTCYIPAHLFNDGSYRIRTKFLSDSAVLYIDDEAAMFTVHDLSERVVFSKRYIGTVRPKLAWETVVLSQDA